MSVVITEEIFTQLHKAADQCTKIVFEHARSEKGVHLETSIYAPCFLAGKWILDSTGANLSKLQPGEPVFASFANAAYEDNVNDKGKDILDFMKKACSPIGLVPIGGWGQPVPEENQALQNGIDLVLSIESAFSVLIDDHNLSEEYQPFVAALTGIVTIKMGQQSLNPDIGKAIALSGLLAGCKTVPHQSP